MKKLAPIAAVLLLTGCSTAPKKSLQRLSVVQETSKTPTACRVLFVEPVSPAQDAQIQVGHTIERINGVKPEDITQIGELLKQSPTNATIDLSHPSGATRQTNAHLNDKTPRLGIVCDMDGWRSQGLSEAGNSALSVFDGPYALTVSGVVENDFFYARVRVANHSSQPLTVGPDGFTATDGSHKTVRALSAQDVMRKMYGEEGARLIHDMPGMDLSSGTLRRGGESYAQVNANYFNRESFWSTELQPGKMADGLIYFPKPEFLPMTVTLSIGNRELHVTLDEPKPSDKVMTRKELGEFFLAQKKGAVLRLTLKSGKVFVGKFTSFDVDNEIVWFVTPAQGLLTTTSYGLSRIMNAQGSSSDTTNAAPPTDGEAHDERLFDSEFLK